MTWRFLLSVLAAATAAGGVALGSDPARRQRVRGATTRLQQRVGERAADRLPVRWRRSLAARLVAGGADPASGIAAALTLRLASLSAALAICLVVSTVVGGGGGIIAGVIVAAVVVGLPDLSLRRRISRRRAAMARDLPRILDLLVISVEAGLGLDQALGRVVRTVPGELADEFAQLLTEVGAGVARAEALRDLAGRCPVPELRSLTLAMVQADTYGVAVGPLLRSQADEIRTRLRQAAQMRAQKAPVKLLVPMVLCIFPALLVVVAGPALLSVRSLIGS